MGIPQKPWWCWGDTSGRAYAGSTLCPHRPGSRISLSLRLGRRLGRGVGNRTQCVCKLGGFGCNWQRGNCTHAGTFPSRSSRVCSGIVVRTWEAQMASANETCKRSVVGARQRRLHSQCCHALCNRFGRVPGGSVGVEDTACIPPWTLVTDNWSTFLHVGAMSGASQPEARVNSCTGSWVGNQSPWLHDERLGTVQIPSHACALCSVLGTWGLIAADPRQWWGGQGCGAP